MIEFLVASHCCIQITITIICCELEMYSDTSYNVVQIQRCTRRHCMNHYLSGSYNVVNVVRGITVIGSRVCVKYLWLQHKIIETS